jgi:hypothetical protein
MECISLAHSCETESIWRSSTRKSGGCGTKALGTGIGSSPRLRRNKNRDLRVDEPTMDIDPDKIDEAVLALLYLTRCDQRFGAAAWKSHDWDALNRLHEKGYIDNPVSKNKSVGFTEEGKAKAEQLFWKLFGKSK